MNIHAIYIYIYIYIYMLYIIHYDFKENNKEQITGSFFSCIIRRLVKGKITRITCFKNDDE